MNKVVKIIGVSALIVTLVCNLQYSFFSEVNKQQTGAKAAWTDMYGSVYCGQESDGSYWKAGTWYWVSTTAYYNEDFGYPNGYQDGIWYFVRDNEGSQCGLDMPSTYPGFNYMGYEITAPNYPQIAY
ncbi:hypothetical protein [Mucilaginibacter sp. UR6-11]|uniref:hypothetical protein n=1 Tax=Mucilaginibacter sp. UR6-11 TaxID=1435644 RepID=UPI001E557119|nr:hypothetical protein [Mucilaginibacter sp. UR6-11]MCC8423845.1 hypothetical protein [Mucilaginibacter sp. UR6-11]